MYSTCAVVQYGMSDLCGKSRVLLYCWIVHIQYCSNLYSFSTFETIRTRISVSECIFRVSQCIKNSPLIGRTAPFSFFSFHPLSILWMTKIGDLWSSLSHSGHSGRSSLRSSTEDDDPFSSRNSSLATPRYTVLMLGAPEVGKTLLTNQFMSSSDVGTYSALTGESQIWNYVVLCTFFALYYCEYSCLRVSTIESTFM